MRNATRKTRSRHLMWVASMSVLALLAPACGSDGGSSEGGGGDANGVINMVMAPDPVWKWLEDQGIRQEMEEEAGIQVLTASSYDEFGVYAGGHADVISASTYEIPDLEEATGEPATAFGKYNSDRSILAVGRRSPAQNICDLEGQKVATYTSVSLTLIWGMYARELCDLDLSPGGSDYELVVTDIQNLTSLVARGDAAASLALPDFAISDLMSGDIVPLYDGMSASQMWAKHFGRDPEDTTHPQSNVFVARQAWVDNNPEEASFLVALWDRGLQEWREHRDEIIAAYPEDFAVRTEEEADFLKNWLDTHFDWFVDTAYLDEEWIAEEQEVFDLMRETGFMDEDVSNPNMTILEPSA